MKTEFEEFWSKIMNPHYEIEVPQIKFWYLDAFKLNYFTPMDIVEKEGKNFHIIRLRDDYERILVPMTNIYVVTCRDIVLMDRREHYHGNPEYDLRLHELGEY